MTPALPALHQNSAINPAFPFLLSGHCSMSLIVGLPAPVLAKFWPRDLHRRRSSLAGWTRRSCRTREHQRRTGRT